MASPHTSASEVIDRLIQATNEHDLEGIVGCFAADYRNETPAHPARGFVGRDQVRRNWTQILAAVPDITATVRRVAVDGDTVWTEQEHRGTRPDGSARLMRAAPRATCPSSPGSPMVRSRGHASTWSPYRKAAARSTR